MQLHYHNEQQEWCMWSSKSLRGHKTYEEAVIWNQKKKIRIKQTKIKPKMCVCEASEIIGHFFIACQFNNSWGFEHCGGIRCCVIQVRDWQISIINFSIDQMKLHHGRRTFKATFAEYKGDLKFVEKWCWEKQRERKRMYISCVYVPVGTLSSSPCDTFSRMDLIGTQDEFPNI